MHELSLLFAYYLLKKRGHRVVYLGQSVPLNDLAEIERIRPTEFLLTSFLNSMNDFDILNYLSNLNDLLPGKTIYVTGSQTSGLKEKLPANVKHLDNPRDLINLLTGMNLH